MNSERYPLIESNKKPLKLDIYLWWPLPGIWFCGQKGTEYLLCTFRWWQRKGRFFWCFREEAISLKRWERFLKCCHCLNWLYDSSISMQFQCDFWKSRGSVFYSEFRVFENAGFECDLRQYSVWQFLFLANQAACVDKILASRNVYAELLQDHSEELRYWNYKARHLLFATSR